MFGTRRPALASHDESHQGSHDEWQDEWQEERHEIRPGLELHVVRWPATPDASDAERARPPVLLVHGLASNARLWDGVARRLASQGHETVAVDQRGHGRSAKPDDGYDMETVSEDLSLLIAALGFDRPLVAGQSWGGNVVLELAARRGDQVRALACVDGGMIDLSSRFATWDDAVAALAPPRLAGTPRATIVEWLERSASDWPEEGRQGTLANFELRDDDTVAPWLTFDRHLAVLRGLWDHRPAQRYASVDVPVLLIPASPGPSPDDRDRATRAAVHAAEQHLRRVRTEWIAPAHHDVHAQRPELVAELLHRAATDEGFFFPIASTEPGRAVTEAAT